MIVDPALGARGHDLDAFAERADIVARDCDPALSCAQIEIGLGEVACDAEPSLIEQRGLLGDAGVGGFERTPHLAP